MADPRETIESRFCPARLSEERKSMLFSLTAHLLGLVWTDQLYKHHLILLLLPSLLLAPRSSLVLCLLPPASCPSNPLSSPLLSSSSRRSAPNSAHSADAD
eukprot:754146-Hanusia_phi.AAC.1